MTFPTEKTICAIESGHSIFENSQYSIAVKPKDSFSKTSTYEVTLIEDGERAEGELKVFLQSDANCLKIKIQGHAELQEILEIAQDKETTIFYMKSTRKGKVVLIKCNTMDLFTQSRDGHKYSFFLANRGKIRIHVIDQEALAQDPLYQKFCEIISFGTFRTKVFNTAFVKTFETVKPVINFFNFLHPTVNTDDVVSFISFVIVYVLYYLLVIHWVTASLGVLYNLFHRKTKNKSLTIFGKELIPKWQPDNTYFWIRVLGGFFLIVYSGVDRRFLPHITPYFYNDVANNVLGYIPLLCKIQIPLEIIIAGIVRRDWLLFAMFAVTSNIDSLSHIPPVVLIAVCVVDICVANLRFSDRLYNFVLSKINAR